MLMVFQSLKFLILSNKDLNFPILEQKILKNILVTPAQGVGKLKYSADNGYFSNVYLLRKRATIRLNTKYSLEIIEIFKIR